VSLFEFPLPDIGEGVAEGEVVEWKVAVGDTVAEDDILCEVMTDKATVEIPSPLPGTVKEIKAEEGAVTPVGAILLTIEPAEGAHIPTVAQHGDHGDDAAPAAEPEPEAAAPAEAAPAAAAPAGALAALEIERPEGQRALATPYTRKLAREAGVDIERIRGNGEAGRVTPADVEAYVAASQGAPAPAAAPSAAAPAAAAAPAPVAIPPVAPAPVPVQPAERETRIPIRGLRKKIMEKMHVSKSTAAHFTYVDEVDVTELVQLRRELKADVAEQGVKLTYMPFIMKAVVAALKRFPSLNGLTDDARQEFVQKHYFNIGVAVDTDNGLIVPVVKDVDKLNILDCANEVMRVATDARDGKSKLEDLQDGTFTITNAGNIGGLFATPVINYPEAAILGVHAIKKKPWIVDGEIAIRDIMYLSISIDHRMNDGATGAYFMNHVVALLQDPRRLMLEL
jgi:pyruvate dehydrogenase E2 component (dihydrolipoamide acetyltransferase)